MTEPIVSIKANIWNDRFKQRMDEIGLSQRKFSALYKERFKTGNQSDVSRWMNVGITDGRNHKPRKFPEFETMQNISEILGVSVSYLIGETDFETFEMEKASRYTGLSPTAIKSICALTSGKLIPPFHKYPDPKRIAALELLLSNPILVDYLKDLCNLIEAHNRLGHPQDYFARAVNLIPERYRDTAIKLWEDHEEATEQGINPTEELWTYVKKLDDAVFDELGQTDIIDKEIKSAKYALLETHIKMIDKLLSEQK